MSKKNTVSIRQNKFIDKKKKLGFKRMQFYISSSHYDELLFLKNSGETFSTIIENLISKEYKKHLKTLIKRNKYEI